MVAAGSNTPTAGSQQGVVGPHKCVGGAPPGDWEDPTTPTPPTTPTAPTTRHLSSSGQS